VTLPSISLKQRTSMQSSISESAVKMALPLGCAHQLPMIGWPATASATLGTGPRAEASTTPWRSTNRSQRLAGVRAIAERFRPDAARLAGFPGEAERFRAEVLARAGFEGDAGDATRLRDARADVADGGFGRLADVAFAVRVLGITGG
jgi:hypothetical protein